MIVSSRARSDAGIVDCGVFGSAGTCASELGRVQVSGAGSQRIAQQQSFDFACAPRESKGLLSLWSNLREFS